jgi:hypothetical protein
MEIREQGVGGSKTGPTSIFNIILPNKNQNSQVIERFKKFEVEPCS